MLFGDMLCGTTDCPLAPGLAVQPCLLHPRQYISLCISQNASCFGISGCSCTTVNRMYGHGSLTCDWPQCAYQCMGQFTASAPRNLCRGGTPPHSGRYSRVPPVLPGPGRDRDAPWGFLRGHHTTHPHTAAATPESLRSCLGRGGIGTPRGGYEGSSHHPPPHSGGYTRVPPVLPGPGRDRDAPWGL